MLKCEPYLDYIWMACYVYFSYSQWAAGLVCLTLSSYGFTAIVYARQKLYIGQWLCSTVLLLRWALQLSSFPSKCQLWLITSVRALHHLMDLPRPSTSTQHTSRLSNRSMSIGRFRIEKLQYGSQYSERILEEMSPDFHQIK